MAYPEKIKRNEKIYYLYLNGKSYREIALAAKLKSKKSVYRIVMRLRVRHKNAKTFIEKFERAKK